jgi:hypothetical protein
VGVKNAGPPSWSGCNAWPTILRLSAPAANTSASEAPHGRAKPHRAGLRHHPGIEVCSLRSVGDHLGCPPDPRRSPRSRRGNRWRPSCAFPPRTRRLPRPLVPSNLQRRVVHATLLTWPGRVGVARAYPSPRRRHRRRLSSPITRPRPRGRGAGSRDPCRLQPRHRSAFVDRPG